MHRSIEAMLTRRRAVTLAVAAPTAAIAPATLAKPADPLPEMVSEYFDARKVVAGNREEAMRTRCMDAEKWEEAWDRVFALADLICEATPMTVAGVLAQTRFLIDWRAVSGSDAGSQFERLDAAILAGIAKVEDSA